MEIAARLRHADSMGDRILKIDHAGEHGAVNIYGGQAMVCKWRATELVPELLEFKAHEQRHRALFGHVLAQRGVRRCRSYHLCGLGGLVFGLVTGLLGRAAIAATTAAVERVVLRHLEFQLVQLASNDVVARAAVLAIVADEKAHHDRAVAAVHAGSFWPRVVMPVVSASTEAVIWLGMRL
jgi:3-demethoxyubiquinol 3-hydroxylase